MEDNNFNKTELFENCYCQKYYRIILCDVMNKV